MNSTNLLIFTLYSITIATLLIFASVKLDTEKVEVIEEEITPMILTIEEEKEEQELKYLGEYKITYYCACEKCCGKTNGITASGAKVQAGVTVAAPKEFKFGTQLMINDHIYTVQDRGGAIKNKRIDIYCSTHEEALKNGVDYYDVYELIN